MASAQEIQVEATSVQHDKARNIYRYEDARLQVGDFSLNAQSVEIHPGDNRAFATGQVRFRENEMSGTAKRINIDLDTGEYTLFDAHIYDSKNGMYLKAEKIHRPEENRFIATNCTLTSCSPRKGGWLLRASEIVYRTDSYATGTNTTLEVGGVPVFYFPWMAWPTVKERQTGFLAPSLEFQDSSLTRYDLGTRLKVPFFWAINVDHDLTIVPETISNRGLASDWIYNYAFWDDQRGNLRFFAIDEANSRRAVDENIPVGFTPEDEFKLTRHTVDWSHNQGFGGNQRMILTLNQSSDGQVRREYLGVRESRPFQDIHGSYSALTSPIAVSVIGEKSSEFIDESVFADSSEFTDGVFQPKLLPRMSFNTGVQPFSAFPLGLELTGHVTRFVTDRVVSGRVGELRPAITIPLRLGGSWELRSSIARRFVQYEELNERITGAENELNIDRFDQNEVEIELRATWARVFPGDEAGARAFKHQITPRLIFFDLEDKRQPLSGSFNLADLESGAAIPEDELKGGVQRSQFVQQMLTLRLDNKWLVRSGAQGEASELAHFNIIQPYNLLFADADANPVGPTPDPTALESEPGEPLMPMILSGRYNYLGFNVASELRYHHQLKRVTSRTIGLSGAVSPRAKMRVNYSQNQFQYRTPDNKLRPEGSRLRFSGLIKISPEVSMGYSSIINLRDLPPPLDRRLESANVYVSYNPGCYALRIKYSEDLEVTRSGGTAEHFIEQKILLTFTLGGLGEIESTVSPGF